MMNIYQAKKETDKHLVTVNWEERKKSGGGGGILFHSNLIDTPDKAP